MNKHLLIEKVNNLPDELGIKVNWINSEKFMPPMHGTLLIYGERILFSADNDESDYCGEDGDPDCEGNIKYKFLTMAVDIYFSSPNDTLDDVLAIGHEWDCKNPEKHKKNIRDVKEWCSSFTWNLSDIVKWSLIEI